MDEFWAYNYLALWLFFLYGFAGELVEMPGDPGDCPDQGTSHN